MRPEQSQKEGDPIPELFSSALALVVGVGLGLVFFGGLWWTVRRGLQSKFAPLWFLLSLPVRMTILLFGIYWINGGHWFNGASLDRLGQWDRLVPCLTGLLGSRYLVIWLTQKGHQSPVMPVQLEAPDAS